MTNRRFHWTIPFWFHLRARTKRSVPRIPMRTRTHPHKFERHLYLGVTDVPSGTKGSIVLPKCRPLPAVEPIHIALSP